MRIGVNFHTTDEYISGVELYTLDLLNALLRIDPGNNYIVFTNQPGLVSRYVTPSDNLTAIEIKHLRARVARILWEHTQLPRLAARSGLDVLHCPSYICPLRGISVPYVVTIHDTIAIDHPEWCKQTNALYFNFSMRAAAKKASRVISVSKCTVDDIMRNFGLSRSKIRVIHPGVSQIFVAQRNVARCCEVRTRYNLPKRYILYSGNVEPKKNIWTLLCVQRRLQKEGFPHKLVIVGKRTWGSEVEIERISEGIRSDSMVRPGYIDRNDLPCVYQMADVFVFLSLYEGFGFPPLEAMACGTPVVSTNRGSLKETIAGAALTVEPYDVKQITQAIASVITDSHLRNKHVRQGLERSSLFSWDKAARETLSVYEDAATTNGQQYDNRAMFNLSGQLD